MFGGTSVVLCENQENFEPMCSRATSNFVTILKSGQIQQPKISSVPNKEDIITYPWDSSWLSGEQYQHILLKMDSYCKYLNFKRYDRKTHPLSIYTQPQNGLIYFVRGDSIGSDFGFPRLGVKKVFKWKKMNFTTNLPKKNPVVSYIVASAMKCLPRGEERAFVNIHRLPDYRMHAVILKRNNREQSFVLCHIRKVQSQNNKGLVLKSLPSYDSQFKRNEQTTLKTESQQALGLYKSKSHNFQSERTSLLKETRSGNKDTRRVNKILGQELEGVLDNESQSVDQKVAASSQISESQQCNSIDDPFSLQVPPPSFQTMINDSNQEFTVQYQNLKQFKRQLRQEREQICKRTLHFLAKKKLAILCGQPPQEDDQESQSTQTSPFLKLRNKKTLLQREETNQGGCQLEQEITKKQQIKSSILSNSKYLLNIKKEREEIKVSSLKEHAQWHSVYDPFKSGAANKFPFSRNFLQYKKIENLFQNRQLIEAPYSKKINKMEFQSSPLLSTAYNSETKTGGKEDSTLTIQREYEGDEVGLESVKRQITFELKSIEV